MRKLASTRILVILLVLIVATPLLAQETEYKPENLGKNVNSAAEEICPVISPDGRMLYFSRQEDKESFGGLHDQDIWYSTLVDDGTWAPAVHMARPLNDSNYNVVFSVSPDGNTLLLLGASYESGAHVFGCSFSHRTRSGWSIPVPLKIKNFYTNSSQTSAYLSNDQKVLLFSLEREDSYGGRDIYGCFLDAGGTWSEPRNLGSVINTDRIEGTPFLAADGVTLYFSSEGHGGYGDRDIFVSRRLDDSWQKWSPPENLGPTINTPGWDGYYTIPASGDYAYLVTDHGGFGQEDICRVKLPKKMKPNPVVLVSGRVLNSKTKSPISAAITYSLLSGGRELGTALSDSTVGEYKIVLPSGDSYQFHAVAAGFYPITENLDASKLTEYEEIQRDLLLAPIEKNMVVRLNNIFFEYGKTDLRAESYPELDRVVDFMKKYPEIEIEIGGHTDSIGDARSNLLLSRGRAQSVTDYIIKSGIAQERIKSKGYGKTRPVATNSTEEGRQQNRRVEFTILKD